MLWKYFVLFWLIFSSKCLPFILSAKDIPLKKTTLSKTIRKLKLVILSHFCYWRTAHPNTTKKIQLPRPTQYHSTPPWPLNPSRLRGNNVLKATKTGTFFFLSGMSGKSIKKKRPGHRYSKPIKTILHVFKCQLQHAGYTYWSRNTSMFSLP